MTAPAVPLQLDETVAFEYGRKLGMRLRDSLLAAVAGIEENEGMPWKERVKAVVSDVAAPSQQLLSLLLRETIATAQPPVLGQQPSPCAPAQETVWELKFTHRCEGQGCDDLQCRLCQHNPYKRCREHFATKYLVGDTLTAKCGALISVECTRIAETSDDPPIAPREDLTLQMCLINGSTKGVENAALDYNYEDISLLDNNKGMPLLLSGGGRHDSKQRVLAPLNLQGPVQLPGLQVTDSSEAMLPGRKSTFRLVVVALRPDGSRAPIKPAVSVPFVVATRRIKGNIKEDFPTVDDPVGKLEHIGKQTEEKLRDLKAAARNCNIELHLPYKYTLEGGKISIQSVGQLRQLMRDCEVDTHLRKQLMQVLKMNQEQWQRAYEHALRAVDVDNRLRKWQVDGPGSNGLLFPCKLGKIDHSRPVGLLQAGEDGGAQVVSMAENLTQAQREMVNELLPRAVQAWSQPDHMGWEVCEVEYDWLAKTGSLMPAPPSSNVESHQQGHSHRTHGNSDAARGNCAATPFATAEAEAPLALCGSGYRGGGPPRGGSSGIGSTSSQSIFSSELLALLGADGARGLQKYAGGPSGPAPAAAPLGVGLPPGSASMAQRPSFTPSDSNTLTNLVSSLLSQKRPVEDAVAAANNAHEAAKRPRVDAGYGAAAPATAHGSATEWLQELVKSTSAGGGLPSVPSVSVFPSNPSFPMFPYLFSNKSTDVAKPDANVLLSQLSQLVMPGGGLTHPNFEALLHGEGGGGDRDRDHTGAPPPL